MDKKQIQYLDKHTKTEDFKDMLLKRNEQWIKKKSGVDDYNDSLRTVVLSCVDSRVPVERIFNAKPGELLVLKNAGNLVYDDVLRSVIASIYSIHVKNIVILGHTNCGMAIKSNVEKETKLQTKMGESTLKKIQDTFGKDPMEWFGFFEQGTWEENSKKQAEYLKIQLTKLLPEEKIPRILSAVYDLTSGKVEFLN